MIVNLIIMREDYNDDLEDVKEYEVGDIRRMRR
jgi:hypothetical protein